MSSLLSFKGATAKYGAITAIHDVSVNVDEGEIVALIGANGAGKSTLMMSIFGQPGLSSGKILFENREITHAPAHSIAKRGIAIAPEGRRIFPGMTTEENLLMGAFNSPASADKWLEDVYELFPRLRERSQQRAGTMSGGEQQMLAIGRALMSKPKLLLLDEPSLGLAPLIVKQIFAVLAQIAKSGTTIFLVEQNANHALRLADRGYVLVNGRVSMQGDGDSLLNDPDIRRAYLGGH